MAWSPSAPLVQGLDPCPWEVEESRFRGPHAQNWPHGRDAIRDPMEMIQVHIVHVPWPGLKSP